MKNVIQKLKDCKGCAKRREYLTHTVEKAKRWFKPGSNAARRLIQEGAPSRKNNPRRRDRPSQARGTLKAGGTTTEPGS